MRERMLQTRFYKPCGRILDECFSLIFLNSFSLSFFILSSLFRALSYVTIIEIHFYKKGVYTYPIHLFALDCISYEEFILRIYDYHKCSLVVLKFAGNIHELKNVRTNANSSFCMSRDELSINREA